MAAKKRPALKVGDHVCYDCGEVNGHKPFCRKNEAEVLSVYSTADAIRDGVLVDCRQGVLEELNQNAGIHFDTIVMTRPAFDRYVAVPTRPISPDELRQRVKDRPGEPAPVEVPLWGQDIKGRYWDVVWMFRMAAGRHGHLSELSFQFYCLTKDTAFLPNERRGESNEDPELRKHSKLVTLCAKVESGDEGEPKLTFFMPGED